jgi:hypothetical protein
LRAEVENGLVAEPAAPDEAAPEPELAGVIADEPPPAEAELPLVAATMLPSGVSSGAGVEAAIVPLVDDVAGT